MKYAICFYCGQEAKLVGGEVIYPRRPDLHDRKYWYCEKDRAWVGTHKNSKDYAPLGSPANADLRALRRRVHELFDPLWKSGRFSRRVDAYRWLAARMGRTLKGTHVGWFREDDCNLAITILQDVASWPTNLQSPT